ncbi:MAG: hypothetical protein R3232_11420 [Clostridia bacterium]|nr:hypothetical protein [Clostridia bacterium]
MASPIYHFFFLYFKYKYKKPTVYGVENYDPSVPAVFMSNHEKFYGPIIVTTRFPVPKRTWANSMTVELKACRKYVAESLFMGEHGKPKWISKIYGFLLGTLVSHVISNSNPIVAYWDKNRARKSIKSGVQAIVDGENQLMFGRRREFMDDKFTFMPGYLLINRIAIRKHGITPKIYPVALNKKNATMSIGKPVQLDIQKDFNEESERINSYLTNCVGIGYEDPAKMASGL